MYRREDFPVMMTADEAAKLLRVHPKTIYELVRRGELPARHIGRTVRIDRDALFFQVEQAQIEQAAVPDDVADAGL